MARSLSTTISFHGHRERYIWPDAAINIWIIIMLATAGVLIGIFANFVVVQNHFQAPIPWIFPFGITVGALTVAFIVILLLLISQRQMLPQTVILLTFVLFALYLTGIIETAIQLFGSSSNINGNCQTYVIKASRYGPDFNTLAWLEQYSICQSWYAVFAFWIVGSVFLVWLGVIAYTVGQATYD